MKLRLGPLPRTDVVKITFTAPIQLKEQLDQYAEIHSTAHGEQVEAITLIPHILTQFITRDHAFKCAIRRQNRPK